MGEERQVREKPERGVGEERLREADGEGRRREAVDNGQQKEAVRKMVKDGLAFLVAFVGVSRKIFARENLQNAQKAVQKRVTKLSFLRLELTQVYIVRLLFFFSHDCIS